MSDGIGVSISLGGETLETSRFRWEGWNAAPPTTEREKPSLDLLGRAMRELE